MKNAGVKDLRAAMLQVDAVFQEAGIDIPEGGFCVHPENLPQAIEGILATQANTVPLTTDTTATAQEIIRQSVTACDGATAGGVSYHASGMRAGETKSWVHVGDQSYSTTSDMDLQDIPEAFRHAKKG